MPQPLNCVDQAIGEVLAMDEMRGRLAAARAEIEVLRKERADAGDVVALRKALEALGEKDPAALAGRSLGDLVGLVLLRARDAGAAIRSAEARAAVHREQAAEAITREAKTRKEYQLVVDRLLTKLVLMALDAHDRPAALRLPREVEDLLRDVLKRKSF